MLCVGDGVTDDVLQEDLEYAASLLVDQTTDTLDSSSTSQPPDRRLGDSLDVVTENLPVTLRSSSASHFHSTAHELAALTEFNNLLSSAKASLSESSLLSNMLLPINDSALSPSITLCSVLPLPTGFEEMIFEEKKIFISFISPTGLGQNILRLSNGGEARSKIGIDLDAVAAIRRKWLSEILLWFGPHYPNNNNSSSNSGDEASQGVVNFDFLPMESRRLNGRSKVLGYYSLLDYLVLGYYSLLDYLLSLWLGSLLLALEIELQRVDYNTLL